MFKKEFIKQIYFTTFLLMLVEILQMTIALIPVLAKNDQLNISLEYDYTYNRINDEAPLFIRNNLQTRTTSLICHLNSSGLLGPLQYNIFFDGNLIDWESFESDLKEAMISCNLAFGVLEIGKQDWRWGKGFIQSPTCPLPKDLSTLEGYEYWGGEWMVVHGSNNFRIGMVKNDESNINSTSWIQWGKLLESSDYTFVLTYQDKTLQDCLNLGLDYSRDFLNGLTINLGINRHINLNGSEAIWQYLIEGQYIFKNNLSLVVESEYQASHLLAIALNNYADMFGSWQWEISNIIDCDNSGQIRRLSIKYIKNDFFTPEFEIIDCSGSDYNFIRQYPMELVFTFKVTLRLK